MQEGPQPWISGTLGKEAPLGDPGLRMFPGRGLFKGGRRGPQPKRAEIARLGLWRAGKVRAAGPALQEEPPEPPLRLSLLFEKEKGRQASLKAKIALPSAETTARFLNLMSATPSLPWVAVRLQPLLFKREAGNPPQPPSSPHPTPPPPRTPLSGISNPGLTRLISPVSPAAFSPSFSLLNTPIPKSRLYFMEGISHILRIIEEDEGERTRLNLNSESRQNVCSSNAFGSYIYSNNITTTATLHTKNNRGITSTYLFNRNP